MNRQRLLFLALLLLGCTAPPPPQADTHAIVNGEPAPDDNAVGELRMWYMAEQLLSGCSATLIAPRVALTAAHCVIGHRYVVKYVTFSPLRDPDVDRMARVYASSWTADPLYDSETDVGKDHDFAVVRFANDVAAPIARLASRGFGPDDVGAPVRFVGYGLDDATFMKSGQRRQTTSMVESLSDLAFRSAPPHTVCHGDSGGPAFIDLDGSGESVVGVASRTGVTMEGVCVGPAIHVRVDVAAAWIEAEAARDPSAEVLDDGCAVVGRDPDGALWLLVLLAIRSARPAPWRRRPAG